MDEKLTEKQNIDSIPITWQQTIGIDNNHLVEFVDFLGKTHRVHKDVKTHLQNLSEKAAKDDNPFVIVSAYRDFDRQLTIWNQKWQGNRPVLSKLGKELDVLKLSNQERFDAISLWSALPGMSRHHWGTDFDIFCARTVEKGYDLCLIPEEFSSNGPCAKLEKWLQNNLSHFGFFRPYRIYQQGVSEEPWHISYQKISQKILNQFDLQTCHTYIKASQIEANEFIVEQLEYYYQQYFTNLCET